MYQLFLLTGLASFGFTVNRGFKLKKLYDAQSRTQLVIRQDLQKAPDIKKTILGLANKIYEECDSIADKLKISGKQLKGALWMFEEKHLTNHLADKMGLSEDGGATRGIIETGEITREFEIGLEYVTKKMQEVSSSGVLGTTAIEGEYGASRPSADSNPYSNLHRLISAIIDPATSAEAVGEKMIETGAQALSYTSVIAGSIATLVSFGLSAVTAPEKEVSGDEGLKQDDEY